MLSLLISILVSFGCVSACISADWDRVSIILSGIGSFFLSMFLIGLIVRGKSKAVQDGFQAIMTEGQARMNRKIQQFQNKPGGNPKAIQRQLEADQTKLVKQALEYTDNFESLKKWNILMGRQIATMRLQFNYQLKEFEKVDALLASRGLMSGPMFMEPMTVAMKMARQYQNGDYAGAEKTFRKHQRWFRGARKTLLYGLLSWIKVQNDELEEARQLLATGKEKTSNDTLARNWEALANNNAKKFSNAGLGEEWYGLYLETPKAPKQKRMRENPRGQLRY